MIPPKIQIDSRQVRDAMRAAAAGSQKALQVRFKSVASMVASAIAGEVPKLTGTAAGTVRARATTTGASIIAGGPKAPYYPWLDFGGTTGRGHEPGHPGTGAIKNRTFITEGRYMFPIVANMADIILNAAEQAESDALTDAGWTVT